MCFFGLVVDQNLLDRLEVKFRDNRQYRVYFLYNVLYLSKFLEPIFIDYAANLKQRESLLGPFLKHDIGNDEIGETVLANIDFLFYHGCVLEGVDLLYKLKRFLRKGQSRLRPVHPNDIELLSVKAVRERQSMVDRDELQSIIKFSRKQLLVQITPTIIYG